jgi:hypothetical protein
MHGGRGHDLLSENNFNSLLCDGILDPARVSQSTCYLLAELVVDNAPVIVGVISFSGKLSSKL